MHGTAALRRDFVPASGLLQMLGSTGFGQLNTRLRDRIELERLRKQTDNDLAELKDAAAWLASHCEQPAPDDVDLDWLTQATKGAQEKEREATAHFRPVIAALRGELGTPRDRFEAEVQQLLRDGIEVLEGWLAFYHGLYAMLARQAEELRLRKVLHARPVRGEIDYAELSREHIARYPKIRAALAE
jgi:hypothetical protein